MGVEGLYMYTIFMHLIRLSVCIQPIKGRKKNHSASAPRHALRYVCVALKPARPNGLGALVNQVTIGRRGHWDRKLFSYSSQHTRFEFPSVYSLAFVPLFISTT